MTTARLTAAACALLLTACVHVRGNPTRSSAPLASAEGQQGPEATEPPEPSAEPPVAAAPVREEPLPEQRCARGQVGRGALAGIGATFKVVGTFCIVGGPLTVGICVLAIAAYPEVAIGTLAGAAAVGALVGGLTGYATCPSPPPLAAPPAEPSAPPPEPADPVPVPAPREEAPGVSWAPGSASPALG